MVDLLEFILVKILFLIFKLIGYKLSSNIGGYIGRIFGPIFRSKKKIIENLKKANISLNEDYSNIAISVLTNYGRIFSEYPYLKEFRNGKLKNYIEVEGLEHLENLKKQNKSAVFISGHFNNFELMAMQIEKAGINLSAIYRPLNNIFLNGTMEKIRKNYICKNQIKKGRSGTRELISNLKNGSSIALMIDQRVREGSKVNFFGDLASTTTIPAQLIKKYKCDLIPVYIARKNKFYFKMYISEPIFISSNKTIDEITLFLNNLLEKMILKNPSQWIWTHNRWKK